MISRWVRWCAAVGSALALGCGARHEPGAPSWSVIYDDTLLGGVLLSIWQDDQGDVFAVGGGLGNGTESFVLRGDGVNWKRLEPGGTETFWWVFGRAANAVWMVGEKGRIVAWDGSAFVEHPRLTEATLFGVWSSPDGQAWAVGGSPGRGALAPNDVVLHWDGESWMQEILPGPSRGEALYKVWGTGRDDLFVVGENGALWHRHAGIWMDQRMEAGAAETLFTVSGCSPSDVVAAGGQTALRWDGLAWHSLDVPPSVRVVGIACYGAGDPIMAVGGGGLKLLRSNGAWHDDSAIEPYTDLHATWMASPEDIWAVGGDYLAPGVPGRNRRGVLARHGSRPVPLLELGAVVRP